MFQADSAYPKGYVVANSSMVDPWISSIFFEPKQASFAGVVVGPVRNFLAGKTTGDIRGSFYTATAARTATPGTPREINKPKSAMP
jgi:hypothetical protein